MGNKHAGFGHEKMLATYVNQFNIMKPWATRTLDSAMKI